MGIRKLIALVALTALTAVFVPPAVAKGDRDEGEAVSLYTAPMNWSAPRILGCSIANVSDQTRTVTISPHGVGTGTWDLAAGASLVEILVPNPGCTDGGCPVYCTFTLQGGKHNFRAAICLYDGQENPLACLPAQ